MRTLLLLISLPLLAIQQYTVCASGCDYTNANLQTAIADAVTYQDVTSCVPVIIRLTAGETYTGNYTLPAKTCAQYVRIRSSALYSLPANVRVSSSQTASMAKVIAPNDSITSTIRTVQASGTGYWALEGLEISSPAAQSGSLFQYTLLGLPEDSTGENQPALTPHHILVDRSYLHNTLNVSGPLRCVGAHGRHITITNSYLDGCGAVSGTDDGQAIFVQNGQGPFYFINNYLAGTSENILIGQGPIGPNSSSATPWLTQRFAFTLGNHMTKPTTWKYSESTGVPTWTPCLDGEKYKNTSSGQWYICNANVWSTTSNQFRYWVKNIYEHKEGQAAWVRGNSMGPNWPDGQSGNATLINQSNTVECNVRDINIDSNAVPYAQIFMTTGYFGTSDAVFTSGLNITNNLMTGYGTDLYGRNGANGGSNTFLWSAQTRQRDVLFDHNTFTVPGTGSAYYASNITKTDMADGAFTGYLQFRNNAIWPGQYLWNKDSYPSNGWCTWRAAIDNIGNLSIANNLIVGASGSYSTGDSPGCPAYVDFPTSVVFGTDLATTYTSPSTDDWTMKAAGPGKAAATDGTDIGVDFTVLNAATATAISGTWNTYLEAAFRSIAPASTSVSLYYTAPSTTTCTLAAATTKAFSATVGTPSTTQTGRTGTGSITGLTSNTTYWLRLSCGADRLYTQTRTL